MALQLAPEEPEAGPWRVELLSTVVNAVTRRRPDQGSSGRPAVLAVDGRSNSGKTTLAARISELVPGSAVIHTDDIAWEHSRFGWADLLVDGILVPLHHGRAVSYRPPRWDEHGREGSIEVPAGCPLLIIEGDGAGRREVAHLIDTLIWVQADERGRTAHCRPGGRSPRGRPGQQARWWGPVRRGRMDGRGNTLQHRPADLGTCRNYRLRHPGDPLQPEHRGRHRTASGHIPSPGPASVPGRLAAASPVGPLKPDRPRPIPP